MVTRFAPEELAIQWRPDCQIAGNAAQQQLAFPVCSLDRQVGGQKAGIVRRAKLPACRIAALLAAKPGIYEAVLATEVAAMLPATWQFGLPAQ